MWSPGSSCTSLVVDQKEPCLGGVVTHHWDSARPSFHCPLRLFTTVFRSVPIFKLCFTAVEVAVGSLLNGTRDWSEVDLHRLCPRISISNIMNQIVNLAKLEKEAADKEVVEIEREHQSASMRQR
jgi:hypothetical protein